MFGFISDRIDYKTAATLLALVAIGLAAIYSATYDAHASAYFYKQLLWAIGGIGIFIVMTVLPFRVLQLVAYPSYLFTILLLIAVLLFGKTVSGSTSWFNLGALRIQPSEFAKVTTVLALANYLSRSDVSLRNFRDLMVAAGFVMLPVALIMMQPDTGTAIIYLGMFFPLLYWGEAARFTLLAIIAPVVAGVAALFGTTPFLIAVVIMGVLLYITKEHHLVAAIVFSVMVLVGVSVQFIYDGLKPYQQKRIATFLDAEADPQGAGYNVIQSKVAIGSGGVLGKGYLKGTQTQLNFIPEQWTDFIFCVPAEEFGFLGGAIVLLLFMLLLIRGVKLASIVKNPYASFIAIGITSIFGTHILMNVGMSLGLLPVVGIPLPFLSYGGSALITNVTMVGILMNLYANRKEY